MKPINEKSEGTAVLFKDYCSLDGHVGYGTRAQPKLSWAKIFVYAFNL
jgi:hypothetical protein